jgi:hypothetical protein
MEVIHRRCAGLDVHKETVVACVRLTLDGKVTREVRTFETTTSGLTRLLAWLTAHGCTQVAMEATGIYWKPLWSILSDGDFELVLANAAHIKNVPGRKTDVSDAGPRSDRSSFVPEQEIQELRELLRTRKQLGRQQSHVKNRAFAATRLRQMATASFDQAVACRLPGGGGLAMHEEFGFLGEEKVPAQFAQVAPLGRVTSGQPTNAGGLPRSLADGRRPR